MPGRYGAARRAAIIRRASGVPPTCQAALQAWAWAELGVRVRPCDDGSALAACWPEGLDALAVRDGAPGVRARVLYCPAHPRWREAVCRELGRVVMDLPLPEDATGDGLALLAGDAEALDFAAALLLHPGDLAEHIDAGARLDTFCAERALSGGLVARRLRLLGDLIDATTGEDCDAFMAMAERPSWRRGPMGLASGE